MLTAVVVFISGIGVEKISLQPRRNVYNRRSPIEWGSVPLKIFEWIVWKVFVVGVFLAPPTTHINPGGIIEKANHHVQKINLSIRVPTLIYYPVISNSRLGILRIKRWKRHT